MKKSYIKYISILIAVLLTINTSSFAIESTKTKIPDNVTEEFIDWQNLSDEEKENAIEPQPFSLPIENSVKKSVLSGASSEVGETELPSNYVIVDSSKISTLIKNQRNTQECWAFSTTSIIETNVAKTRNKSILLSPRHIDYATSRDFLDGTNYKGYKRSVGSGNFYMSLAYCVSGYGPVLYEKMPFENNTNQINLSEIDIEPALKVENYRQFADIYKDYSSGSVKYYDGIEIENSTEYSQEDVDKVRNLIKEHLMKYGAVSGYTLLSSDLFETSSGYTAYYNNNKNKMFNHAITIIGWDDNFSRDNFKEDNKPEHDGAYITLNTSYGDNENLAIVYVSYDDVWIDTNNFGIVSTTDIDYDNIYQYDEYGFNVPIPLLDSNGNNAQTGYIANVFDAKEKDGKDEYIHEVSLYIPITSNVDIYINTENDDKTKIRKVASADVLDVGYHTIKFSTPEKITGDKFVVAAKLTTDAVMFGTEYNFNSNGDGSTFFDYVTSNEGESFYSLNMSNWTDLHDILNDTSICLKAFTTYQDEPVEEEIIHVEKITLDKSEIELKEGESATLVTAITPSNADDKSIIWKTDDANIATVSSTGIIKAVSEGTTTITATTVDGGKIATCTVTVKGQIPIEDEIYYNDNNDENINDAGNINNNNSSSESVNDTTRATGTIPQTGEETLKIVSVIIIVLASVIIVFIKYRKSKDVK